MLVFAPLMLADDHVDGWIAQSGIFDTFGTLGHLGTLAL